MKKRIIGIDPGSHKMGIGCIDQASQNLKLVFADTLTAPADLPLYERLKIIGEKLETFLELWQPEEVALEDSFFAKNAKSAFQLGITRGMVFTLCMKRGIKIYEYAPAKVKQTVTGYGRADKEQVKKMVGIVLGSTIDSGLDASDALAIAVCHASQTKLQRLISC